jgi:hypothetical protein
MRRLFPLLVLTSVTAAWAQTEPAVRPIEAKAMQPGYGVVEKVSEVRLLPKERSAATGGSSASEGKPVYRITVRMPDGSTQQRDLDRPEFKVGDNVLLTNAGDILPD